jgi:hypothetical protein
MLEIQISEKNLASLLMCVIYKGSEATCMLNENKNDFNLPSLFIKMDKINYIVKCILCF